MPKCPSHEHIESFLNYLNSQHPNINFTCKVESNKTLPFLDITISRSNDSFITSVYRKPTFTGLFTNFESFLPVIYKKGLIYTILFRYLNICSSYSIFQEELAKFKSLLLQNGYPQWFIDYCVCSFLNKVFDTAIKPLTAPKLQLSIALPFTGSHSLKIRQQLLKLISLAHPHVDLQVIFRPVCRFSHFFHFKDQIPMHLRSDVIYKFTCQCCSVVFG